MEIKIQPADVRRKNAKLIGLAIFLSIPFYCWVLLTDLDHALDGYRSRYFRWIWQWSFQLW